MANLPVANVRANISMQLGEVTQLKQVTNSRMSALTAFPAARFFMTGLNQQLISNAPRYFRTIQFTVEVIMPLTNISRVTAEAELEDAVEAVLDKLGTEWLLDDTANATRVTGGSVIEIETTGGTSLVATIVYEVDTFYESNS